MSAVHLPECRYYNRSPVIVIGCICDQLRACEERWEREDRPVAIGAMKLARKDARREALTDAIMAVFGAVPAYHPNCIDDDCLTITAAANAIHLLREEA